MVALMVYESVWGNLGEVAEAVASGLRRHTEVIVLDVTAAPATLADDVDLIVAGAASHASSLSSPARRGEQAERGAPLARTSRGLREWLDELAVPGRAPEFAIFDVRLGLLRPVPSAAGRKAAKIIAEHGYGLVSEPHTFYVHGRRGPLDPGERGRAALWGERVALEAQLARESV